MGRRATASARKAQPHRDVSPSPVKMRSQQERSRNADTMLQIKSGFYSSRDKEKQRDY